MADAAEEAAERAHKLRPELVAYCSLLVGVPVASSVTGLIASRAPGGDAGAGEDFAGWRLSDGLPALDALGALGFWTRWDSTAR